jgi:organic hydroperoxide reductase OsmC/OhrA
MQGFPHRYAVSADADAEGNVAVRSAGLPTLTTAPPPQFGGAGGQWSPETFLVAAAADCLILTFRAIAAASKLSWRRLACDAHGTLDRKDGVVRFTELRFEARLVVPPGIDTERARRLLEKAEATCLITNSLAFRPTLAAEIVTEA